VTTSYGEDSLSAGDSMSERMPVHGRG